MHAPLLLWRQATRDRDITLKFLTKTVDIKAGQNYTVGDVKQLIENEQGKPVASLRLIGKGKELDDPTKKVFYNDYFSAGSNTLHVVERLSSAPAPGPLVPWRRWVAPVLPWPNRPYGLLREKNTSTCYINAAVQILRRMKINGFQPRSPTGTLQEAMLMRNQVLAMVEPRVKKLIESKCGQKDAQDVLASVLDQVKFASFTSQAGMTEYDISIANFLSERIDDFEILYDLYFDTGNAPQLKSRKYVLFCIPRSIDTGQAYGNVQRIPLQKSIKEIDFTLVGFIKHEGQDENGHFVVYVKYGEKWWFCDDGNISDETSSEQRHDWRAALPQAYILLYDNLSNPCHALCTNAECSVGSCNPEVNCCNCGGQHCACKKPTT